jgi:hypothetical protein
MEAIFADIILPMLITLANGIVSGLLVVLFGYFLPTPAA